jgi:cell division protein FtsQ
MSSAMDRRIAARRRSVREAGARRRLRWLLGLVLVAGLGALAAWLLLQSSILAVRQIHVSGVSQSAAADIVIAHGVAPGVPTLRVPAAELEQALMADPWIAQARVRVTWPGTVEVEVLEHRAAGWLRVDGEWLLASGDGTVLEVAAAIPDDAPIVRVAARGAVPGDVLSEQAVVAALDFLSRLPAPLVAGAWVGGGGGALLATVAGHPVELGYPTRMAEKASALVAILETGDVPKRASISVVSPQRPAVRNPRSVIEGSAKVPSYPGAAG